MSTNGRFAWRGSGPQDLREVSGLELEAGGRQPVQPAPHQTIHEHDDGGHDQRGGQQHIEAARIAGATNGAAEARGRNDVALKMEVLGGCMPRPPRETAIERIFREIMRQKMPLAIRDILLRKLVVPSLKPQPNGRA